MRSGRSCDASTPTPTRRRPSGDLAAIVAAYRKLGRAGVIAQARPVPVAPRHIDVYA